MLWNRSVVDTTGSSAGAVHFDTRTAAAAATIADTAKTLSTGGYATPGDRGHGNYARRQTIPPDLTNPGYFRSVDRYCLDGTTDATNGGYWELIAQGGFFVEQFGGKADYYLQNETTAVSTVNPTPTDNHDAIIYASHYLISGKSQNLNLAGGTKVIFGYGGYYVGSQLIPERTVSWEGMGYGVGHDVAPTWLVFPAGVAGIEANCFAEGGFTEQSAGSSLFRGLYFYCLGTGGQTTKHGFTMDVTCAIEFCGFANFGGDGVNIVADTAVGQLANIFYLQNCWADGCAGHGFHTEGGDANAGVGIGLTALFCGGYGIYDNSFLGNTWVGAHTNGNTTGPYFSAGGNCRAVFLGCYSEQNQPVSSIGATGHMYGGLQGAGVSFAAGSLGFVDGKIYPHNLASQQVGDEIEVNVRRHANRVQQVVGGDDTEWHSMWVEDVGYGTQMNEVSGLVSFIHAGAITAGRAQAIPTGAVVHPFGAYIGNPQGTYESARLFSTVDVATQFFVSATIVPYGVYAKGDLIVDHGTGSDQGAWAYYCDTGGGVAAAWVSGTSYIATGNNLLIYIKSAAGRFYRCTTPGGGTSTIEPVHVAGSVTGADGYTWKFLTATTAVFKRTGPAMDSSGNTTQTGLPTFKSGTAPAAGGTQFVSCSSTAGLGFYFGTGVPSITAGKGSIYSNTTAITTTTRLYVNTDGGTTWTNLTTAA